MHPDPGPFQRAEQGRQGGSAVVGPGAQLGSGHGDLADRRELAQRRVQLGRVARNGQLDVHGVAVQPGLQLVRAAGRHDRATLDDGQLAGEPVGLLQVVRGQQDGEAFARGQPRDLIPHRGARLRVQARGRLVEEQHLRPVDQPHGHVEPALHAAGVGPDHPARGAGQVEPLQQLAGPPVQPPAAQALDAAGQQQVLPAGGGRVGPGSLGDHADGAAHGSGLGAHVETGHAGRPGIGLRQGSEDLDGGGLAGPVGAEQPEDRALLNREAEPVESADFLGVGLDEIAGLDGQGSCGRGAGQARVLRLGTHGRIPPCVVG